MSTQAIAGQAGAVPQPDPAGASRAARSLASRRDGFVLLALSGGVLLYLATLPLTLAGVDEAHSLHYAQRILQGDVLYRDFFDLDTPGWVWLMAALFQAFGTTLRTARSVAAVILALVAASSYVACRRLGVRRLLAAAAALGCVAVAQTYYFAASQHWLATLLCMLLLVLCLRTRFDVWTCLCCGLTAGALVLVHQGRGAFMASGAVAYLAIQARLDGGREGKAAPRLLQRLAAFAAGALAVTIPALLVLLARSGPEHVWRALVLAPLVNYRAMQRPPWGFVFGHRGPATVWALIKFIPMALLPLVYLLSSRAARRANLRRARGALALVVLGAFSLLSIAYYPDVIHIALVAPLFLVAAAASVEWGGDVLPRRFRARLVNALALGLLAIATLQLAHLGAVLRQRARIRYVSAFGPVDLSGPRQVQVLDALRALLDRVPGRLLYAHPISGYQYLLLDARNPTRFAFVTPPYTDERQQQEIIDRLAKNDVLYVLMSEKLTSPQDRVAQFIRERYVPLAPQSVLGKSLWRRR
jgi:hypothetical protein